MTTPQPTYEYEEDTFHLVFDDPKYAGLQVEARELPFGETATIMGLIGGGVTPESAEKLLHAFSGALVSWNLAKKGVAIPCTVEGLNSLSLRFVMPIAEAWFSAVIKVDAPLPGASSDGVTPGLEANIPTETLSPSPQS